MNSASDTREHPFWLGLPVAVHLEPQAVSFESHLQRVKTGWTDAAYCVERAEPRAARGELPEEVIAVGLRRQQGPKGHRKCLVSQPEAHWIGLEVIPQRHRFECCQGQAPTSSGEFNASQLLSIRTPRFTSQPAQRPEGGW